ncbi:helix-turn-helix domain-containing protein [Atopobacter phocae]|uniref:helix-turn-helix domain-containing protein n=1 Tax=Atopobacter phocae TaxID=136492 RepID=UPI00047171B9|nr:helix-turn-helix transcriptional regulator [Atopobacter phocae]
MKIKYNGLWKILIDKNMNKKDLAELTRISPSTIAKMSKGDYVSLDVLYRIGQALGADFGDMISMDMEEDMKK